MTTEQLIDKLEDLVDQAWSLPLSGGRSVLDADKVRDLLEDLRDSLPQETRQAKAIVADRSQIINDAKREAETVVRVAEERAKKMINQHEIVKQAQARANDLLAQSQAKAREMRRAANDYVDDLMKRTDEQFTANLAELRKTRQSIKASQRSGNQ